MNNDNINTSAELEQMRSEFEILKNKLNSQDIINDKLMRSSMRAQADVLDRQERVQYACAAIAILCSPSFHYGYGASWYFVAATILFMLVCVFFTWRFHRNVKARNMDHEDLLTVQKNVKEFKRNYSSWLKYGLAGIVIWIGMLSYEIISHSDNDKLTYFIIGGMAFGVILGGIIGLRMHFKVLRTCDEMISQIED